MRFPCLLVVLSVLLVAFTQAAVVVGSNQAVLPAAFRAGARSSNSNKISSSSRAQKGGGGSKNKKSSKRKNEVGPWSNRGKKSKASSFKTRLEKLAKQGQFVYKDVYRRAKVLRSSAFEAMLLKATWPSNDPVQPDILGEIIKYSIPAFKYSNADAEDDPFYMTLHKLWTKMSEADWRTVAKSLYILHTIARDCQSDACAKFGIAIKDLSKTRNPKNPEHKYFSIAAISKLDELSAEYEPFVSAYAAYVIQRAKTFTARFDELKGLSVNTTEKKALAVLKKAQQLVKLGLATEVPDKKLANAITGYASKQVGNDLRDVYALMGEKIKPLLSSSGKYADSQAGNNVEVLELLKFYQSLGAQVKALLEKSAKQYARLRIKIPLELDQKSAPTAEAVAQRIRELSSGPSTSLSGGALAADTARSSSAAQGSDSRGGQHSQETSSAEKKRVLHKADRPLTPEEVQLSAELAGQRCYASMSQASQRSPARISSPLKEKGMWQGSGGATEDEDEDEAGEEEDEVADEEEGDEDEADEAEEGVTEEDADEEEEDCQDCGADHHASRHDAGDDEDAEDTEEAAQEEDGDLQEEADGEDDEDAEPAGEEEGEAEEEEGEGDGEEPEDDGADAEADEEGEGEGDDEGEGEDEDADGDVDTEDDE